MYAHGLLHAAIGQTDEAFKAFRDVEVWWSRPVTHLRYYYPNLLGPLREDPRYKELIGEINRFWGLNPDGTIPQEASASETGP